MPAVERGLLDPGNSEQLRDLRVGAGLVPFIATDKGKDLRKISFAGGLLGYQRKEDETLLLLFWFPMRI